jgi:hypothetical protein
MTEIKASAYNFRESKLSVKAVKVTNTLGRIIKMGELVYISPWFGNALEDIAIAGSGYIGIDHEREIYTEQITITDTFAVDATVYFLSGGSSAAGTLEDSAASSAVAVGTITAIGGTAGAHTSVTFKPFVQKADLAGIDTRLTALEAVPAAFGGKPFRRTAVLTSALATTPVDFLTSAQVGAGKKVYITDVDASVGGTAVWAGTGTVVLVRDKAASPVTAITFAKAQLGSQAQLGKHSAGVTLATPVRTGVGMTAAKGIEVVADGTFETTGSDLTVTITGFIDA